MDSEADDALFDAFISAHPQHARADRGLDPEGYSAWVDWLGALKTTLTADIDESEPEAEHRQRMREAFKSAGPDEAETTLLRRLRTGQQ